MINRDSDLPCTLSTGCPGHIQMRLLWSSNEVYLPKYTFSRTFRWFDSPFLRHFGEQRSANTMSSKKVWFLKRTGLFTPKNRSAQHVRIPLLIQAKRTVQLKFECQFFFAPKSLTEKRKEFEASRGIQNINRNVQFRIIVANCTWREKIISKSQLFAIYERLPRLVVATKETTGEIFGFMEDRVNKTKKCQRTPEEIQELSFPKIYANITTAQGKMHAPFADMWSGKLWFINFVEHRSD